MKPAHGFTLIELLITIGIVAILAAIALPAYSQYKDRAKFTEVAHAVEPIKTQVDLCIQSGRSIASCQALTPPTGASASAAVDNSLTKGPTISASGAQILVRVTAAAGNTTDVNGVPVWSNQDATGGPGGKTFTVVGTPVDVKGIEITDTTKTAATLQWRNNPDGNAGTCVAAGYC